MHKSFIKNTFYLTFTSIIIRLLSIIFRVYTVSKTGSEGIGVYQLVLSVYMFASTICTSGITLSVTRLVTDNEALSSEKHTRKIISTCLIISIVISALLCAFLFTFAGQIGIYYLQDARCVPSLKILAFSLPFMAVSACFRGYFYAKRKAYINAFEQLIEQIVEMTVFFILIHSFSGHDISFACCAIATGTLCAEAVSFVYSYFCFRFDVYTVSLRKKEKSLPSGFKKKFVSIFFPITGSACLRSGLSSFENTLIPNGLRKYGLNTKKSLSDYGIITGMVMPVITFPSALLYSAATLLIPEISQENAKNNKKTVKAICSKSFGLTLGFVIPVTAAFIFLGQDIGEILYKDQICGKYISILAPILPLMYIDAVTDGILKGLNDQLRYFTYNVIDSVIRVTLTFFLVPIMGIKGIITVIYVSEILNTFLSVKRLVKLTDLRINVRRFITKPVISCLIWIMSVKQMQLCFTFSNVYISLLIKILIFLIVYISMNDFDIKKVKLKAKTE